MEIFFNSESYGAKWGFIRLNCEPPKDEPEVANAKKKFVAGAYAAYNSNLSRIPARTLSWQI